MTTLSPGAPLQSGVYRIEAVFATSSVGITYFATQVAHNVKVVVKELFVDGCCTRPSGTTQVEIGDLPAARKNWDQYIRKFIREAQTTARLDHPNIVQILDIFQENNTAYYVSEFAEGPSLAVIVGQQGQMPENEALHIINQIGDALQYIHDRGLCHLDITPANIVVRNDDKRAMLIDFGHSRHYDLDSFASFSPQADIFSLAATLYELLTGHPLPETETALGYVLPDLQGISSKVRAAIEQAVHPRTERRPATVMDFLRLMGYESDSAPHTEAPQRSETLAGRSTYDRITPTAPTRPQNITPPAAQRPPVSPATAAMQRAVAEKAQQKKAAEQKMKYSEVSQEFARNMARNQHTSNDTMMWTAIIAGIALVAAAVAAYFFFFSA